jgi:NADH dehydrogenase
MSSTRPATSSESSESSDRPIAGRQKVVIVGGGFAGVACAKELGRHDIDVTLIDKNTYHQFQPLLYQVATAQLAVQDVRLPLRELFRKRRSVMVKNAAVTSIDPASRSVSTDDGVTFSGDHLVLAMGTQPNFFGVPGAEEHAFPLYSTDDAMALRDRVLRVFEDADLDPGRIDRGALNFVIVGGGPTGVETAGALADLIGHVMPEYYHDLDVERARIIVVDRSAVVLAPFSDKAHDYASKVLTKKGVTLRLESSVQEVRDDRVLLDDGSEILTHCVVWAGGLKSRSIDGIESLPRGRGGRVTVGEDLSVDGYPGLYVVGDAALTTAADGSALPQLGAVALQAGTSAADSILAEIAGERAPSFRYHDKGIMAMIGRRAAIAEVGSHHHELHGAIAFGAWLGVHAWLLNTTRTRVDAFISWAWDWFTHSRSTAYIGEPDVARIDWAHDDYDDDDDDDERETEMETT